MTLLRFYEPLPVIALSFFAALPVLTAVFVFYQAVSTHCSLHSSLAIGLLISSVPVGVPCYTHDG